ncbi:MAG: alpha/beta hydrolase [Thermoflexus sp.]|jgi:pimeloyl-ACP methyl ester carboxylesterase|nr:alpha/beta hydrolase [Thermoflexus sp.]MDT7883996.1 alpha/beta hydrolase [Thermoflexus sp.]MDT7947584.1 alpha/beta hydrolase [Thermoflexus sp.]
MREDGLLRDFGGEGPLLHLAVANGFPPACYRPFMRALREVGHGVSLLPRPLWPERPGPERGVTWYTLADDLIAAFEARGWRGVVGIGHSMGGVITMVAAVRRPELFSAIVLMDPVLMDPKVLTLFRIIRWLGLGPRLHPLARRARRRRRAWPSREAAAAHLRSRPLFAAWHPEAFEGYLEEGLLPASDGQVVLAYPPEWEVHIFVNVPHDAWRFVPHIPVPTLVVRGASTDTFTADAEARFRRLKPDAHFAVIPGGHLFPMERPEETAALVREWLRRILRGA